MIEKLEDYIAVKKIEQGYYITDFADVIAGFTLLLPEIYTTSEQESLKLLEVYRELIHSLKDNTTLHFQFFNYIAQNETNINSEDSLTIKRNKEYYKEKESLKGYVNLYICKKSKSTYGQAGRKLKLSQLLSLYSTVRNDLKYNQREIKLYEGIINSISSEHYGIKAYRKTDEELGEDLYRFLNLDFNRSTKNIYKETPINPIHFDREFQQLKVGNKFVGIQKIVKKGITIEELNDQDGVTASQFGLTNIESNIGRTLKRSYLYPIHTGLFIDHILNIHIEKPKREEVEKSLKSEKKQLKKIAILDSENIADKLHVIDHYLYNFNDLGEHPINININVVYFNENYEQFSVYRNLIGNSFDKIANTYSVPLNGTLLSEFLANAPGNESWITKNILSTTNMSSLMIPRETHYISDKKGYQFNDLHNNRFTLDLSKGVDSQHGFVFAMTGMGKTYFFQTCMDTELNRGEDVAILNTKDDYIKFVGTKKGKYITADLENSLNPFIIPKKEGRYHLDEFYLLLLESTIDNMYLGLNTEMTQTQKSVINKSLVAYYDYINEEEPNTIPSISSYFDFIPQYKEEYSKDENNINVLGNLFFDFNELRNNLTEFVHNGSFAKYFNGTQNIDITDEHLSCFDLMKVKDIPLVFNIYLNTAFALIQNKIMENYKKGIRTNVYVDECIDSLKEKGGEMIGDWYRKNRSYGSKVWTSTQNIKFLDAIKPLVKDSILDNSAIKIFMGRISNEDKDYFKTKFSFTQQDYSLLDNLKKYETYIKIGEKPRIIKNLVSPYTDSVYSTTDSEKKKIKQYYDEYKDINVAIELYSKEKN